MNHSVDNFKIIWNQIIFS